MKKELTTKQKKFCLEYLKSFNATDAYRKVYWGQQKTCEVNGCKLLRNTKIAEYLADKTKEKIEKADLWVDYVLNKLQQVIDIWMWVQAVELEKGKPKKVLDLSNVNSALEKLWKYHKMYTDKIEQSWDIKVEIVSYKDYPDEWRD